MAEDNRSVAEALAAYLESNATGGPRGASNGFYRIDPDRAARWLADHWEVAAEESRSRLEAWLHANGVAVVGTADPIGIDAVQDAHNSLVIQHWEVPAERLGK